MLNKKQKSISTYFFKTIKHILKKAITNQKKIEELTKWGKINCMVFIPQLQEGRVFKEEEEMKIWISDDENKLMIKVETKIIVGVIKAELSSFKGLKNPLSITE